jgi:acetyl esterase/lipase
MIRKTMALVAAALLAAGTGQAAPPRVFAVSDQPSLDDHFPVRPVLFPKGVNAYRDVAYQQLPGYTPQVVDIYVPATRGPHPLVLYIHGGGWVAGHTRHSGALADFPAVLAALAAEGFTVASLEYRLSAEARFPAQLQDAKAALRFLGDHAGQYRIDASRVGIWGGSAGGHLTALTALTCKDASFGPAAAKDICASAAVTWYGVFDFGGLIAARGGGGDMNAEKLLGCSGPCTAEQYAFASPLSYIDARDPPFLLIHGTEDKTVPVGQSHTAEAALRQAGVPVEAIYIAGVDHSFIGSTPAQTRNATLQAVNATFDFLHAKLGVPRR